MKKYKVFIACDTSSIKKVKKIISKTKSKELEIGYKFGLEFFYSKNGRKFISKLKNKNIFLDLKLNDIPNTCIAAIRSLKDLTNISYITVHLNGGYEMLRAVKKEAIKIKKLKILGVSVLTSLSNSSLKKIGHTKKVEEIVKKQVHLAKLAKLNGIVCSGLEVKSLRKSFKNIEIFTPGIRFEKINSNDQKRVTTAKEAFRNGATAIVIGRSITNGDIEKNIEKLTKSLLSNN